MRHFALGTMLVAWCLFTSAVAQVATPLDGRFTYQGRLTKAGAALDGSADFIFTLKDAETGGSIVGVAQFESGVVVVGGLFTVDLDFGVSAFNGDERWLEIQVRDPSGVGMFTTLTPRQSVRPAPYALQTRGMFVDEIGNVGIGTTNPSARLDVAGTPGADGIRFPDGTTQTTALVGGGVPSGFLIASESPVAPLGFTFSGLQLDKGGSQSRPSLGEQRWSLKAVSVSNKAYAISGEILGGFHVDWVQEFDPSTGLWTVVTNMPTPRLRFAVAAIGNKVFIFGGSVPPGSLTNVVDIYDIEENQWLAGTPMPTARTGACAAVLDGKIYVIGGGSANGNLLTVEEYDPVQNSWSTKAETVTGHSSGACAATTTRVYVLGGFGAIPYQYNVFEEYDPDANTWTAKANLPQSLIHLGAVTLNDRVYLIGGRTNEGEATSEVYEYDPIADQWLGRPSLDCARTEFGACVLNGYAFIIGGWTPNGPTAEVEAYAPPLTLYFHRKD